MDGLVREKHVYSMLKWNSCHRVTVLSTFVSYILTCPCYTRYAPFYRLQKTPLAQAATEKGKTMYPPKLFCKNEPVCVDARVEPTSMTSSWRLSRRRAFPSAANLSTFSPPPTFVGEQSPISTELEKEVFIALFNYSLIAFRRHCFVPKTEIANEI